MKKNLLRAILSTIFVLGSLYLLQLLFVPKYMEGIVEGALTAEYYYNEPGFDEKNHNVIFIGDCEVYENFSPMVLWEEYGINSFIRGNAQQLLWHSYYILEDTLKYETPDVVVFNVLAMKYNEPQKETYNRMAIDGLPWSMTKVNAINASMMEEESFVDYVFPLLRYHARWNDLNSDDFKYMFTKDLISHNGYYMRLDVKPLETLPTKPVLADYNFGDYAYEYLQKMVDLCKEQGIELVLIKAPTLYPFWYDEWEEQMVDFAATNEINYINYIELVDEVGIDFTTDTYDAGLHLNLSGAEKLSVHFGEYLMNNYDLTSLRGNDSLEELWQIKRTRYDAEIAEQKIKYNLD